jgi:hypothetical protein
MPLRNIDMTRIWREWSGTLPAAKGAENFSCPPVIGEQLRPPNLLLGGSLRERAVSVSHS